ncbi:MAG: leucyl aminopeptidase [Alphaproteobacteria bacterium]|nr:leucyl aminopeptidase [Alphaproteobacteria bacterium]
MSVVFSKDVDSRAVDVCVFVADVNGKDSIDAMVKNTFGGDVAKSLLGECKDLSYAKTHGFGIVLDGKIREIIIAGAGDADKLDRKSIEKLGGYIFDAVKSRDAQVHIYNGIEASEKLSAAYLASGMLLKSWHFDKYKNEKKPEKIKDINCKTNYTDENATEFERLDMVRSGVFSVRSMVTEPANVMTPDQMLVEAKAFERLGVKVSDLDRAEMAKLGMNALLGVAKGSDAPAYLITMEYKTDTSKAPVALVGKGLTFDSGGLCLKPAKGMGDMKGDMTGAAVVIGTLKALALQNARVNVVGVIGVVENMISGSAQKPGDVVKAMSGKTIEVDNTDAEGRLVLADALWYAKTKYAPKVIVDFATLTGAIQVALGHEFAGLFSNSDALCDVLQKASDTVGEKLWRLPLCKSYEDDIKSDIADIKNVGSGRGAGSITAAMFLQHFVDPDVLWAHIDIAATEWDTKNRALSQKGATGFGVRLMDAFLREFYGD